MTKRTRHRQGVIKLLGNIADDSKELLDDLIDRARDVDRDLRDTTRRALKNDDDPPVTVTELEALQQALVILTDKVNQLTELQQQYLEQSLEHKKTTPTST